ncbi:MAG: hypothetical protein K6E13_03605 [Lachnospiraceae bacterium]|nr:hypothetical protein [Lachnospiraceae bacterium]
MDYNMPPIEGINWEKAHGYLPEKEMLLMVLEEYVKTCKKQTKLLAGYRDILRDEASDENFASYRIQAHAMKSTLRSLGAELFDMAYSLEMAGKEKSSETIMAKTDIFIEEYTALSEKIRGIVGDCDRKKTFDGNLFFVKIKEIKNAMDIFDVTTLQEAARTVLDMELPTEYEKDVSCLEEAVRNLDSDTVEECCERLLLNDAD